MDGEQFLVMVDSAMERAGMVDGLYADFPDLERRKENSCQLRGNWLEIWSNDDADESLAADPDTGYLHFRWRVEVTPMNADAGEEHQVRLARDLLRHFRSAGARAEVLANFEDRL